MTEASSEKMAPSAEINAHHDVQAGETETVHDKASMSLTPEDAELALALEQYVPGTPEEKRLVRKIDFILLPTLWWMYILAYLDRGNIVSAQGDHIDGCP